MFLVAFYSPITIPNAISTTERGIDIGNERGPADLALADGVAAVLPDVLILYQRPHPPRKNPQNQRRTYLCGRVPALDDDAPPESEPDPPPELPPEVVLETHGT